MRKKLQSGVESAVESAVESWSAKAEAQQQQPAETTFADIMMVVQKRKMDKAILADAVEKREEEEEKEEPPRKKLASNPTGCRVPSAACKFCSKTRTSGRPWKERDGCAVGAVCLCCHWRFAN